MNCLSVLVLTFCWQYNIVDCLCRMLTSPKAERWPVCVVMRCSGSVNSSQNWLLLGNHWPEFNQICRNDIGSGAKWVQIGCIAMNYFFHKNYQLKSHTPYAWWYLIYVFIFSFERDGYMLLESIITINDAVESDSRPDKCFYGKYEILSYLLN